MLKTWTKDEALQTLKELANEADKLRNFRAHSTEHIMWMTKCLETLEEVLGRASRYYLSFADIPWNTIPSGTIIDSLSFGGNDQAAMDDKRWEYFLRHLEAAKGFLLGAANFLKEREISEVYKARDTGPEASLILRVLRLAEHQLRKVIRTQPEKENQVQDAFENILIGADVPYKRETDRIEYSSKTYIPDFSIPKIELAVDIKLCGRAGREKEIIAEMNDDILAYQTKYRNLLFLIYDLGYIRDMDRFSKSFDEHENVTVKIVKH